MKTDTPESDAACCEFAPTNDPRYEGPVEWVPLEKAQEIERDRNGKAKYLRQSDDHAERLMKERDEARLALSAANGIFDAITQSLTKERDEALAGLEASNEARAIIGERWLGLSKALREISVAPGRSCHLERLAKKALSEFGQQVVKIP